MQTLTSVQSLEVFVCLSRWHLLVNFKLFERISFTVRISGSLSVLQQVEVYSSLIITPQPGENQILGKIKRH